MIEDALRLNFTSHHEGNSTKMAASDYEPRICAIDVEYTVFRSNKLLNTYKANIVKVTGEIKKMTKDRELHSSLAPEQPAVGFKSASALLEEEFNNCDTNNSVSPDDSDLCDKPVVFTTASDLLKRQVSSTFTPSSASPSGSSKPEVENGFCSDIDAEEKENSDVPCDSSSEEVVVKKEVPIIKYFFEQEPREDDSKSPPPAAAAQDSPAETVEATSFKTEVPKIKYFFEVTEEQKADSAEQVPKSLSAKCFGVFFHEDFASQKVLVVRCTYCYKLSVGSVWKEDLLSRVFCRVYSLTQSCRHLALKQIPAFTCLVLLRCRNQKEPSQNQRSGVR